MHTPFNAGELIDIAVRIERNGAEFYRRAAAKAADPFTAQLFRDLAAMEESHEKRFLGLVSRAPSLFNPFDEASETAKILEAFADGSVFRFGPRDAPVLEGGETMKEILETAVGLEKDSVVFYAGLKASMSDPEASVTLGKIIDEELAHVALISRALVDQD